MNVQDQIVKLDKEITVTLESAIKRKNFSSSSPQSTFTENLPAALTDFYKQQTHLTYEWEAKELRNDNGQKLSGSINILSADKVLADSKVLYPVVELDENGNEYEHNVKSEHLKGYKQVDFFTGQSSCGFYQNESNGLMYYHDHGDTKAQSLGVDFNGYLELMFAARGFLFWQQALLKMKTGGWSRSADLFKADMPKLFPDFKWEEFVALYERVRIK